MSMMIDGVRRRKEENTVIILTKIKMIEVNYFLFIVISIILPGLLYTAGRIRRTKFKKILP